ncbi:hypothetical protein IMSHALPRED_006810 [Imshaugia aleurites]|uniref:Uncharacterized protein n=1 Tax=Imshaugia aleurites TaxID=172621 RepID=A0A8H3FJU0_9LECA|nr:hypothetical protein IMSHALPRED_006810 [Imshaugia aleurites]
MKANTLLREITHIFITYLSKDQGGQNTQVAVKAPIASFDKHPKKGEAGYKLEKEVFGGTMNYMMDPDTGTKIDECGVPYLFYANSRWRILPETIKRTINRDFKFPYEHEKDADTRELKFLASGMPLDGEVKHPMDDSIFKQYLGWIPPPGYY